MPESPPETPTAPPRQSRRFQYSLATLFVLTAVCALVFRFPQAFGTGVALLAGALIALIGFLLFVFFPVESFFHWLSSRKIAAAVAAEREKEQAAAHPPRVDESEG